MEVTCRRLQDIPNIEAIIRAATFFSWIDDSYANESEIPIVNVRNFSTQVVAELAVLSDKFNTGVYDALLLQIMLDAGISSLFSYDKKFVNRAVALGIKQVV